MNNILAASQVGFRYSRRSEWLFRGVDFQLPPRSIMWIKGPSGSGKSTMLSLLSLLAQPSEGEVLLDGQVIAGMKAHKDQDKIRAQQMGLVFQDSDLVSALTIRENIELSCQLAGKEIGEQYIQKALSQLDIQDLAGSYPGEISGGQRQRAAVVRALARTPKVIIADEPTSALDPENAVRLLSVLRQHVDRTNAVAVVVSHDELTADVADLVLDLGAAR